MATLEELESQVNELQELVSADYTAPEGPEFSYPAVGQAVDDEMWKFITLALGAGILDDGGYPYWLEKLGSDSETNQANQMKLTVATTTKTAQAVLKGFYHRLLEDMRLDFPMPLSETTYYVTLELNPLKAKSALGPISVQVYPNELNTESNREHLILWSLTRKPNQLLTDATITRYRPRVSPPLTVLTREQLPNPSSVLYGTVAFLYGDKDIVIARGANNAEGGATYWDSILTPGWSEPGDTGSYKWPGHGHRRGSRQIGAKKEFRGRIARVDGGNFTTGTHGYQLYDLGPGVIKQDQRFVIACQGGAWGYLDAQKNGLLRAYPQGQDTAWFDISNVVVDLAD